MGGGGVSLTPRLPLPPGKTRYPFYRRLGGTPGPVWTGGKSRPHRDYFFLILNRLFSPSSVHSLNFCTQCSCVCVFVFRVHEVLQWEYWMCSVPRSGLVTFSAQFRSFPERPARSQSLYRLRYPAHVVTIIQTQFCPSCPHDI